MFLEDIIEKRKEQLDREKEKISFDEIKAAAENALKASNGFSKARFKKAISQKGLSVIAEVKKASPSKGLIQPDFHPVETALAYEKAGAAAISVLTEEHYFQGSPEFLSEIRKNVDIPLLRKDFIIDPYQIYHAKALGADAVLLIAAVLDDGEFSEYYSLAKSLDMDVLAEAHNEEEVERLLNLGADIIGINNRDLKTFKVDIENTKRLLPCIPEEVTTVCESGIKTHEDMVNIAAWGANAVLIGETLMRSGIGGIADCFRKLVSGE